MYDTTPKKSHPQINIQRLVKFINNNILVTNNKTSILKILEFPTYQEVYIKANPLMVNTIDINIAVI